MHINIKLYLINFRIHGNNAKKILELNPNHPIIKELLDRVKVNEF
jgi:HSP90 family molecular chaperone